MGEGLADSERRPGTLGGSEAQGTIPGLIASPGKLMSRGSQGNKWAPEGIVILQLKDNSPEIGRQPRDVEGTLTY